MPVPWRKREREYVWDRTCEHHCHLCPQWSSLTASCVCAPLPLSFMATPTHRVRGAGTIGAFWASLGELVAAVVPQWLFLPGGNEAGMKKRKEIKEYSSRVGAEGPGVGVLAACWVKAAAWTRAAGRLSFCALNPLCFLPCLPSQCSF